MLLEMLKNLGKDDYLYQLIDFIIFFIEEGFFVKYNFDVFMKTVEFMAFKLHEVILEHFHNSTIHQAIRLVKVFVLKTVDSLHLLTERQVEQFTLFSYKMFNLLITTYFGDAKDRHLLNEDNLIALVGFLKAVVGTPLFDARHENVDALQFATLCLRISVHVSCKAKERVFGLVIHLVNKYDQMIKEEAPATLAYKIFMPFIVSKNTQDAIYALSSLSTSCLYDTIYVSCRAEQIKDERLRKYCQEIIADSKHHAFDIHKFFSPKSKKEHLTFIITDLLKHVHEVLTKIELNFIFRLLNSSYIETVQKIDLLHKVFRCKTKDVQDLYDGLYKYVSSGHVDEVCDDQQFLLDFILFLYENLTTKSVSKIILKTIFLLFKVIMASKAANAVQLDGLLAKLLVMLQKSPKNSMANLDDGHTSAVANKNADETIKEGRKLSHSDSKQSQPKTDHVDVSEGGGESTISSIIDILNNKIKEVNEIKTYGLFFLLTVDFYKSRQLCYKSTSNHPNVRDIVNEYLNRTSSSIVLDSFLLKSMLIDENILQAVDSPKIIESLNNYLLSPSSKLNLKNTQEFSNNYIKNRAEILRFVFEVKSVFLRHIISDKKYYGYLQAYVADIGEYLDELYNFLRVNCECVFMDFHEETAKAIKREKIEVSSDHYNGINDTVEILSKGEFISKYTDDR